MRVFPLGIILKGNYQVGTLGYIGLSASGFGV